MFIYNSALCAVDSPSETHMNIVRFFSRVCSSAATLLLIFALLGCASTPEGRQQQASNIVGGIILGAIFGAIAPVQNRTPQLYQQCGKAWNGWHWVKECWWVSSQNDEDKTEWVAEMPPESFEELSAPVW